MFGNFRDIGEFIYPYKLGFLYREKSNRDSGGISGHIHAWCKDRDNDIPGTGNGEYCNEQIQNFSR